MTKIPQYDIFLGTFGEDASRLDSVEGAGNALIRLRFFAAKAPGTYFVFCRETSRVVASMNTMKLGESTAKPA